MLKRLAKGAVRVAVGALSVEPVLRTSHAELQATVERRGHQRTDERMREYVERDGSYLSRHGRPRPD